MSQKNNTSSCDSCAQGCKSDFSRLRAKGVNGFDPLRRTEVIEDNEPLPLTVDGRNVLYCIKSGNVKLCHANGAAIRICGPGDIIGYIDAEREAQYTAFTLGTVQVCSFDKELFHLSQDKYPEIAKEFLKFLFKEIQIRDDRIFYLENFSVRNKVASTLLSLHKKFGTPSEVGSKSTSPWTAKLWPNFRE